MSASPARNAMAVEARNTKPSRRPAGALETRPAHTSPEEVLRTRSVGAGLAWPERSRRQPGHNSRAEGASLEGARGNPVWVSPRGATLEGAWLEVFRAGDYGERGLWTAEELDRLAAAYNPRLQPAPVVVGHPAADAPAYGWVRALRRVGQSLWAQLEKIDPAFEDLLRRGRFRQRSVALYRRFPPTGGPYLRHLGFLGASAPAVKGLAPVRFADTSALTFEDEAASIQFSPAAPAAGIPEDEMSEPRSKLESFLDHLRSSAVPGAFSERLAALEQRLDSLTTDTQAAADKLTTADAERRREQVAPFVESLRRQGRFPPAFEQWGVADFLERLAHATEPEASDASPEAEGTRPTLLAWFQDFLQKLPAVIEFHDLGAALSHASRVAGRGTRVVSFAEPARGMTIDPASIELAERAETLAAEHGISYAQALSQLREENRTRVPHA